MNKEKVLAHIKAIEQIVIAHQSWTVLQRGENVCHLDVRKHLKTIRKEIEKDGP